MLSAVPGGCRCLVAPVGASSPDFFALACGAVAAAGTSFARGELTHASGVIRSSRSAVLKLDMVMQPPAILAAQAYKGRYHELDTEGDGWSASLLRACLGVCDGRQYGSGEGRRPCSALLRDVTDFLLLAAAAHRALGPAALPSPLVRLFVFDAPPELVEHVAAATAASSSVAAAPGSSGVPAQPSGAGRDPLQLVRFVTGALRSLPPLPASAPSPAAPPSPSSQALLMTLRLFLSELAAGVAQGIDLEYGSYDALLAAVQAAGAGAAAAKAAGPQLLTGARGGYMDAFIDPAALAAAVPGWSGGSPSGPAPPGSGASSSVVADTRRKLCARITRHQAALCVLAGAPAHALELLDSKWKPLPALGTGTAAALAAAVSSSLASSSFSSDPLWTTMAVLTRVRALREAAALTATAAGVASATADPLPPAAAEAAGVLRGLLTVLEDALPAAPPLAPAPAPSQPQQVTATTAPAPAASGAAMTAAGVKSGLPAGGSSSEAEPAPLPPPSWSAPHPPAFLADPTLPTPAHTPSTALLQATTAVRGVLLAAVTGAAPLCPPAACTLNAGGGPLALLQPPLSAAPPEGWFPAWAAHCSSGAGGARLRTALAAALAASCASAAPLAASFGVIVAGQAASAGASGTTAAASTAGAGGGGGSAPAPAVATTQAPPPLAALLQSLLPAPALLDQLNAQFIQLSYLQDAWGRAKGYAALAAAAAAAGAAHKAETALGLSLTALRSGRADATALPGYAAAEASDACAGLHAWYGGVTASSSSSSSGSSVTASPDALAAAVCCGWLAQRSAVLASLFSGGPTVPAHTGGAGRETTPLPLVGAARPAQFAPATLCGALTDAVMGAVGYLPHGERARPRPLRDAACAQLALQLAAMLASVETAVRARPPASASLTAGTVPPLPAVAHTSARLLQCLPLPPDPGATGAGGSSGPPWRCRPVCGAERLLRCVAALVVDAAGEAAGGGLSALLPLLGTLATAVCAAVGGLGPALPSAIATPTDALLAVAVLASPLAAMPVITTSAAPSVAATLWHGADAAAAVVQASPGAVSEGPPAAPPLAAFAPAPAPPSLRLLTGLAESLWGAKAVPAPGASAAFCRLPLPVSPSGTASPLLIVAARLLLCQGASSPGMALAAMRRHMTTTVTAAAAAASDASPEPAYVPGTLPHSETRRELAAAAAAAAARRVTPAPAFPTPVVETVSAGGVAAASGSGCHVGLGVVIGGIPALCRPPGVPWSACLTARVISSDGGVSELTLAAPLQLVTPASPRGAAAVCGAHQRTVEACAVLCVPCNDAGGLAGSLSIQSLAAAMCGVQAAVWRPPPQGSSLLHLSVPAPAPGLLPPPLAAAASSLPSCAVRGAAQVPLFGSAWALSAAR